MSTPEHPPGSPEAVAQGCTCSPALNHNGEGIPGPRDRYYQAELQCRCMGWRWRRRRLRPVTPG
jgi:hypothetical protein